MTASVLERLNFGLHRALEADPSVFILGEDILDPYGGAFKVTRGLSSRFPDRVLTTPISEAGIVGVAAGMAMRGFRPVVEIMFGDFLTLAADQIINHVAKFRWIYNDQVKVPIVVRTPMGGRRGYGPTHSQSLEKIFLGIPGIKVLAVNSLIDPAELLSDAIRDDDPILFIEHKLLYPSQILEPDLEKLVDYEVERVGKKYPTCRLTTKYLPKITVACYGYNFNLVLQAAEQLVMEHELFADIILFSQLSPFLMEPLFPSVKKTGALLTVEEGTFSMGWGAEITARVVEATGVTRCKRVAAKDTPIANARDLEDGILPSVSSIVSAALELANRT
jgi:pyruvate/2-oxoglutarate/acetoin dehydrogenase E1 component